MRGFVWDDSSTHRACCRCGVCGLHGVDESRRRSQAKIEQARRDTKELEALVEPSDVAAAKEYENPPANSALNAAVQREQFVRAKRLICAGAIINEPCNDFGYTDALVEHPQFRERLLSWAEEENEQQRIFLRTVLVGMKLGRSPANGAIPLNIVAGVARPVKELLVELLGVKVGAELGRVRATATVLRGIDWEFCEKNYRFNHPSDSEEDEEDEEEDSEEEGEDEEDEEDEEDSEEEGEDKEGEDEDEQG